MTPFFIPNLPASAEFCSSNRFFRLPGVMAELQAIDMRMCPSVMNQSCPPKEFVTLFAIKDMQLSNRSPVAACGVSLFKQLLPYRQPFSDYLEGLKGWIDFIRDELPDQLLRVYVGNSAWDALHREGILKAKDVDFIRMRHSSSCSKMGQFWRNLVFEESKIPHQYIGDLDRVPAIERYRKYKMDKRLLENLGDTNHHVVGRSACIGAKWHKIPFLLFYKYTEKRLTWHSNEVMVRIADLFQVGSLGLCNGHLQIPYDLGLAFAHCLTIENVQTLYHPRLNIYTKIRENRLNLDRITIDEHWAFYMSRIITTKYHIGLKLHEPLRALCRNYPFMRRLYYQLIDEGSLFVSSREDDGSLILDLIEDR